MPSLAPPTPAVSTAPTPRFGFRGADLGMELASWRLSAPARQAAPCDARGRDFEVCRTPDRPLGGRYQASDLTHTFIDGRLAAISYTTSIDGFSEAVADLKRVYGPPTSIVRDRVRLASGYDLPHVEMTWRNGRSSIRLSDPSGRGGRLSVSYTLDAEAGRLAHGAGQAIQATS